MGAFPVMDPRDFNQRKQRLAQRILGKALGNRMQMGGRMAASDGRPIRAGGFGGPRMAKVLSTFRDSTNPHAVLGLGAGLHGPASGEMSGDIGAAIAAVLAGSPAAAAQSAVGNPDTMPFEPRQQRDTTMPIDPRPLGGVPTPPQPGPAPLAPTNAGGPGATVPGQMQLGQQLTGNTVGSQYVDLGNGQYFDPHTGQIFGTPQGGVGSAARYAQ